MSPAGQSGDNTCDGGALMNGTGPENWFDLRGGLLRVSTEASLMAPLLTYLEPLRAAAGRACVDLSIAMGEPEAAPPGAALAFRDELPEGGMATQHMAPGRLWLTVDGCLSAVVDQEARTARIMVSPGGELWIGGSAGVICVDAALRAAGQTLVHAAALVPPGGSGAILLCGPSGHGKTTTVLAMALEGFTVLTDDAAVLACKDGAPWAWGLPRPMKLHRHSLRLLPALAPALGTAWNAEDEQAVDAAALRRLIDLRGPKPMALHGIVWLGERVSGPHVFRPTARAEIMARLAADNVRRGPLGVADDSMDRFTALARAVATCRVYEIRVGSNLAGLAGVPAAGLA